MAAAGVAARAALYSSVSRPDTDSLVGEWRRPPNDLAEQVYDGHKSIHDDEMASKIGFGAAPIHGTVHWSQFTPLLLQAFGPSWFETGTISVHFVTPVHHLQPVRAFMAKPDPSKSAQQVDIWMEHADGRVVLQGTASVGAHGAQTMVQSKIAAIKPVKGSLLLERKPVGAKTTGFERARIDFDKKVGTLFPFSLKGKLEMITEFHPWFSEDGGSKSPWGRPVLPPEALNQILLGQAGYSDSMVWPRIPEDEWLREPMKGREPVGLFGGCEVIIHSGPVFPGEDYEVTRELVGKGETPRAEFNWVRSLLREPGTGKLVAEMTLQTMMLKSSVEGYEELRKLSDEAAAPRAKL